MLEAYKKHPQARPKMNILVHFWATSLQEQTCFCWEPPTSLSVLKSLSLLAFLQIDRIDTRREHKLTAGVSMIR